ncbi:MAG: extracellular solute-binding protein, partial [Actinobacteria bacterium]|nr:extracellular solute-binding protein [Actinomycetota bacterium]
MYKSKIFKLSMLFLVFVFVVSFSLFGCKEEAAPAEETAVEEAPAEEEEAEVAGVEAPEGEVTIDVWFQEWAGGQSWIEAWKPVFEEKYPTIKINLIFLPFEELNTKIFPAIAAGNEADLMMFYDEWLLAK